MKLLRFAVVLCLVAVPFLAQADLTRNYYQGLTTGINAATLDAATTSFAVNITSPNYRGIYGLMTVWACVTADADNSVTAITMSCTASPDGGTTDYTLQDCTTATGVCTSNDASWVKDPSAMTTKCWSWRVDIEGFPEIECTITDTGGGATDTMTVKYSLAVKG